MTGYTQVIIMRYLKVDRGIKPNLKRVLKRKRVFTIRRKDK